MEVNKIDKMKNYIEENIIAMEQNRKNAEKEIEKLKEQIKEYDNVIYNLYDLEFTLKEKHYPEKCSFKVFKKLVEEIYSEINNSEYYVYNSDIKRYILMNVHPDSNFYAAYKIMRSDISYIYLTQSKISDIEQEVLKNTKAKGKSKLKNYELDDELITRHYYTTHDTKYNQVVELINKNYEKLFKNEQNYIGLGFYTLYDDSVFHRRSNDINKKNINLSKYPDCVYFDSSTYSSFDNDFDIVTIFDDKNKILAEIKNAIILYQKNKLENNFMDFIPKYRDGLITIDKYNNLEDDEIEEIKRYVKRKLIYKK